MSDAKTLLGWALWWAREQWPDAVLVPELSVASWGGARLDLGIVTPSELIGVEIKGEGDSAGRLQLQGWSYSMVATQMFLLPCDLLRTKCFNAKPPGWLMCRNTEGGWYNLKHESGVRQRGHGFDGKTLAHSPQRLVELLWADEVRRLVRAFDVDIMGTRGADQRAKCVAEQVPLGKLRPKVYQTLYERRWEAAGIPKKVWRPDDAVALARDRSVGCAQAGET